MDRAHMGRSQIMLFSQAICYSKRHGPPPNLKLHLQLRRHRHDHSRLPLRSTSRNPTSAKSELKETPLKGKMLSIPGPSWLWTQVQPLAYPFRAYGRAQNRHPYLVQILSSLVIYFLGDLSSQFIQKDAVKASPASVNTPPAMQIGQSEEYTSRQTNEAWWKGFQYDRNRSLRALIIGGIFSLPSYHWFLFLSRNFNVASTTPYSTILSLTVKVVVNQIVFAPLFSSYFFGMQSLLSNSTASAASKLALDPVSAANMTIRESLEVQLQAAWHRVKETVPEAWYNSCKFWPLVTAFSFTFVRPQSRSVFAGIVAIGWQSYLGILNQRAVQRGEKPPGTN